MRNAYIIAQSQLLQLAKQMEYDTDVTAWEDGWDENLGEFWKELAKNSYQSRDEFLSGKPVSTVQIVADLFKSPRKRGKASPQKAAPRLSASPLTKRALETGAPPANTADLSHSDDEMHLSSARQSDGPRDADRLLPPSAGNIHEPQPEQPEQRADAPAAPVEAPADRKVPLPSTTPGTGLRQKRTLSKAALRSTKKPAEAPAPTPAPAPLSKAPTQRFRSSFLNKSLHKAIEERIAGSGGAAGDDSLEPSPFDDSHDHARPADQDPEKESEHKDTTDTTHPPSPPRDPSGQLDALRTRLETARRTSTTTHTHTVPTIPEAHVGRPAVRLSAARPAPSEDRARPATPEPNQGDTPELGKSTTPTRTADSKKAPSHLPVPSPSRVHASPSRIPTALRSPSRLERPGSRLDATPSRLDRPGSRLDLARKEAARANGEGPESRIGMLRSPSRTGLDRSPSRAGLDRSPSRAGLDRSMSRTELDRPGVPRLAARTVPRSPARAQAPPASPWRRAETKPTAPSFMRSTDSPSHTPQRPVPSRDATRSPGRLRDDLLSPFRIGKEAPGASKAPASPPRSTAKVLNRIPTARSVPPARPASPKLTMQASPGERAAAAAAAPSGFGARVKGLLGLQTGNAKGVRPASPQRPASALAVASPAGVRRPASPESPARAVHTALGIHDEDEDDLLAPSGMPGAFDAPPKAEAPVRKVLLPARPSTSKSKGVLGTSLSSAAVRPIPRVPAPSRQSQNVRPSPMSSRVSAAQTYAYDAEAKRRKLSQQPLHESTNQDDRVSTESALKSKLTTSTGAGAGAVRLSKVGHTTARPPSVRPPTNATRTWTKPPASSRSSTLSTANVFQQHSAVADASMEELPDVQSEYSDSDDEDSIKKRKLEPSWTRGRELEEILLQQSTIDPDEIFGCQVGPVPLETMLPTTKNGEARTYRKRTSSANWSGPDGLAQWEIDRYNERMGIDTRRA